MKSRGKRRGDIRCLLKALFWFPVGILFLGLVSGCSPPPPPPPSAETAAVESSLLSLAEVDGGFEEESRGQVGVSGNKLCPESDFAFEDVGAVRVAFVWPTGDDEPVELIETLRGVESDGIEALMADLEAALGACDGVVWTDYGEEKSFTVMAGPEIGDKNLGVRLPANPPTDGSFDYGRTVYVAQGDVFVEINMGDPRRSYRHAGGQRGRTVRDRRHSGLQTSELTDTTTPPNSQHICVAVNSLCASLF